MAKIQALKKAGVIVYAQNYHEKQDIADILSVVSEQWKLKEAESLMQVWASWDFQTAGRIMLSRSMGKLVFAKLRDHSWDIQVCFMKDAVIFNTWKNMVENIAIEGEKKSAFKIAEKFCMVGDYIGVKGDLFYTKHGELTIFIKEFQILSKAVHPLPEKWHGVQDKETIYRQRYLDLIMNKESYNRFLIRSKVLQEVRGFYHEKNFVEVETWILSAQAGGAMAQTFMTHHNALDHDFHLRIALELPLKMTCAWGIERVFEIWKCFRNEGTDPSHLQEFTMLEWYAAYVSFEENMNWNEAMLRQIATNVFRKTIFEVQDKFGNTHSIDFSKEFIKKRFSDLLLEYANFDMFAATDEEVRTKARELWVEKIDGVGRANLLDDIYKKTARPHLIQPTFVLDYPEDLKPLAAPNWDGTALCFQVLIAGWEVINAYGELINPFVQRELLEKQAAFKAWGDTEAMEVDEVFLRAMEHGFPPMAGQWMGIDRIVSLLTGQDNLRDVVLFPTLRPEGWEQEKKKATNLAVVILNQESGLEDWQKLNTTAHLAASFAARKGTELFDIPVSESRDGVQIPMNIWDAIILKTAENNFDLELLQKKAQAQNIEVFPFTRAMIESSDDSKVDATHKSQNYSEIEKLGMIFYGEKKQVEKLTKDFVLYS